VGDSKPSSTESDELQPSIIERDSDEEFGNGWIYDEIDSVPSSDIVKFLINLLRRMGATDKDELIKQISKELGFARVGNRIKARLLEVLAQCEWKGEIETLSDGKVSISN